MQDPHFETAPGNVTQLSNRKLTKPITKPNVLLYTAEGRAVWLSLQNVCDVTHSLYAVCPRKTTKAIRDTYFNSMINFRPHSTEPPMVIRRSDQQHTNSMQDTSVALELRMVISDMQVRQAEESAASCCISFEFERHTQ